MSQVPIEEVLMGMTTQLSEREDALLCSDVRDNLFGPMEFSRRDLGALNIMRGRDNGLPDYNTARYLLSFISFFYHLIFLLPKHCFKLHSCLKGACLIFQNIFRTTENKDF